MSSCCEINENIACRPEGFSCIVGEAGVISLAVSCKWFQPESKFSWAKEHCLQVEYTPDAEQLHLLAATLQPQIDNGIRIRHHAFFPGFEFGAANRVHAEEAMDLHRRALRAMATVGEKFVTCHVGLLPEISIKRERVVENLAELVALGKGLGIVVCLENLRNGLTSDPDILLDIVTKTGASITLDIGHAVTCARVVSGELTVVKIVEMFSPHLAEVHFYEKEYDRHYAPADMTILAPIVDALLKTTCSWWTVELEEYHDVLITKELVLDYLSKR